MKCPHSNQECPHYRTGKQNQRKTNPEIRLLLDAYSEIYVKTFGVKPVILTQDAVSVKRMLKTNTLSCLKENITTYFENDSAFFKDNAYDIARLEKFVRAQATGGHNGSSNNGKRREARDFTEELDRKRRERLLNLCSNSTLQAPNIHTTPLGRDRGTSVDRTVSKVPSVEDRCSDKL